MTVNKFLMERKSNAKINIGLSVSEKVKTGMHFIDTLMVPVPEFYDEIEFNLLPNNFQNDIVVESLKYQTGENVLNESHKSYQTVRKIKKLTGYSKPLKVIIKKRVPVGTGLGLVSSNVACISKTINELAGKPLSENELEFFCRDISSDAPFFIRNHHARVTGVGTSLVEIDPILFHWLNIKIIIPPLSLVTSRIYEEFDTNKLGNTNTKIDYIIKALQLRNFGLLKKFLKNDLQKYALNLEPKLWNYISEPKENEILVMTGSGSAFLVITEKN